MDLQILEMVISKHFVNLKFYKIQIYIKMSWRSGTIFVCKHDDCRFNSHLKAQIIFIS